MFTKALPVPSRLKCAMYGPAGSGKTFSALLIAEGIAKRTKKRIAFVDTEGGTRPYRKDRPGAKVHPEAFDFDLIETKSISKVLEAVRSLSPDEHAVLVIDSISHLWDSCMDAVQERTSSGTIKMQDWGKVKGPFKELVQLCLDNSLDVIFLGRQKNVFEEDEQGNLKKVGVALRSEGEFPHEPDVLLHLSSVQDKRDPTLTTWKAWCEKDRYSVFAGKVLTNMNYETFEPLLTLIGGGEQTAHESNEERTEADVQMLLDKEAKAVEKKAKSAEMAGLARKGLVRATTLEELNEVARHIKKKRGISAQDKEILRATYQEMSKEIVNREAAREAASNI